LAVGVSRAQEGGEKRDRRAEQQTRGHQSGQSHATSPHSGRLPAPASHPLVIVRTRRSLVKARRAAGPKDLPDHGSINARGWRSNGMHPFVHDELLSNLCRISGVWWRVPRETSGTPVLRQTPHWSRRVQLVTSGRRTRYPRDLPSRPSRCPVHVPRDDRRPAPPPVIVPMTLRRPANALADEGRHGAGSWPPSRPAPR